MVIVATAEWTMRKASKNPGQKIVKDIKRATHQQHLSEEKVRIVLDGLRSEDGIARLCRLERMSQGICYKWNKDFMEARKRRLAGDTARTAYEGALGADVGGQESDRTGSKTRAELFKEVRRLVRRSP